MSQPVPVTDPRREYQELADQLERVVVDALRSGQYVLGPQHDAFEKSFSGFAQAAHTVGVANGTDALELVLLALDVGPTSEVITVANAGGYTSTATHCVGATPVFVDVVPTTLLMDLGALAAAITKRTRAIVVTHLYGHMADMASISAIASDAGVALIEDCAQAHGASRDGHAVGSYGHMATYSFYPTKNLGALGDGGAITTNNPELTTRLRQLRQYGWDDRYHVASVAGRNSRLDEVQAAVLRVKLPHVHRWNAKRRAVAEVYRTAAPNLWWAGENNDSYVGHLAVTRTPERDRFRKAAHEAGIGTAIHFPIPDHHQASARGPTVSLPVTELACAEVVSLPCHAHMTPDEIDRVATFLAGWS